MSDPLNTALQTIFLALPSVPDDEYAAWIAETALSEKDHLRIAARLRNVPDVVMVDILIASAAGALDLATTLNALSRQTCTRFSVLVACPRDQAHDLERSIERYSRSLPPTGVIRVVAIDAEEEDIIALEQGALEVSEAHYVAFLAHGDVIASHAVAEIQLALARCPETLILFTDEDRIDAGGRRSMPRLKRGWDPDAQLGFDLMARFSPMRRDAALAAGGLRQEAGLAAHYALHCRLAGTADPARIMHVPSVLYHAATINDPSDLLAQSYIDAARDVARDAARMWEGATVTATAAPLAAALNRISWPLPDRVPLVSVLIPTRDGAELLRQSAFGVLNETEYPAIELLILDNGSVETETQALFAELAADPRVRVLPMPGPFNFSRLNNEGAAAARGDILVLLNNDVEILDPNWLREMVSLALRPEVGCVGARLLYADRRVQHAGISMGPHTGCAHVGRLSEDDDAGLAGMLAITRTHAAVTAACLAIRADVFAEVGGLDDAVLKIGYNDVDLCLKVRDHGYRAVCSPFATLLHLESVSRGPNDDPEKQARERFEKASIMGRWREVFLDDPYQNPNTLETWVDPLRLVKSRRLREWEA